MRKAERAVLVGIVVAIAIALRAGFVGSAQVMNPLRADAGEYAQCAQNLVEHGVYSLSKLDPPPADSFRSPGYPFLLALCRLVGGPQGWMTVALWLQVALGGLTVLLTYRLARACVGFAPALFASALCALSPHLVVSTGYVLTECTTTFVVAAGLWLLVRAVRRPGAPRAALAGFGLGAAVLCNETLLFVPFLAAAALWRALGPRRALLLLGCGLLPFAGWTLRNQVQPLARTGGQRAIASISHGSYPGMVFRDERLRGFPYREDPEQPAFGSSWAQLGAVLGRRVAAEPLRYASWYLLEKPVWLWRFGHVQGNGPQVYEVGNDPYERQAVVAASGTLMRWLHGPVMLLAAAAALGCLARGRRRPLPWLCGAIAVMATLAYVPVIPDPRYLQPIRPVLFVLAASGAAWLGARVQRRVSRSSAASSARDIAGRSSRAGLPEGVGAAPPST